MINLKKKIELSNILEKIEVDGDSLESIKLLMNVHFQFYPQQLHIQEIQFSVDYYLIKLMIHIMILFKKFR